MNLANIAEVVGETFGGVQCIEISNLSIVVQPQQERHLGIVGSFPNDNSIEITLGTSLWCGSSCGLCGTGCWICGWRWSSQCRICPRHCICRCRLGHRYILCRAAIKSALQAVDLLQQGFLLLGHLLQ